ncbi:MAG TPA: hypothetical protein VK668_02595 [Mucilaginibacter sp.]|nr:hypothetical protein [Mucilaginibacter sp.]
MKRFKKTLRVCALILFALLAATGIGIFGVAPTLTRDRKLFADTEVQVEIKEKENPDESKEVLF